MSDTKLNITWEANNFRLTVYPKQVPEPNFEYEKLWPKLENVVVKSQIKSPVTGEYKQEGSYKNNKLTLITMPNKFDLVFSSENPVLASEPFGITTLGNFKDTIKEFLEIIKSWISNENIASISRIGFGVDLFHRVKTNDEGCNTISRFLPFITIDPKTSSDFRLQINKFVQSKIDKEIRINRLTNWGVLNFKMQLTTSASPSAPVNYPEIYYCHTNLDINTPQEYNDEFDKNKTLAISDELISQAIKISDEGIK